MGSKKPPKKGKTDSVFDGSDKPAANKDLLVVGIGASAGGIYPIKEFFAAMPSDSGMAFVVILHLSPRHESHLDDIIQKETRMPVVQVQETLKVEPDHVYVIPPGQNLVLVDGVIKLAEQELAQNRRVPIDLFLRTLADAYGKNGVGVILSGTGSDGTMGIKRLKEAGGITIVQEPGEAEYDGMPQNAIRTKMVDMILPVAEMPEKLLTYKRSVEEIKLPETEDEVPPELDKNSFHEVMGVVKVRTGHDFSNYKRPTMLRRIARRMQVHGVTDIPLYLEILSKQPEEVQALKRDFLISVTNFFRDKESFAALENHIIPQLFTGKTANDQVRVWCVGCTTGEEAYSVAILLAEQAARMDKPPKVHVFASDIDEDAIMTAREGRYDETIALDVSPDRLKRFFEKDGDYYGVKKELRETILFAPHNVLRDPPFSRLDLITCRNVMIYFNRQAQERILEVFHFALKDEGFLFLGTSESAESAPGLFTSEDKKQRVYKKRRSAVKFPGAFLMPTVERWRIKTPATLSATSERSFSYTELHHRLVEQFSPPSILINENYDILHLSENAGCYLRFTGGEPTHNLSKVAHPAIKMDLLSTLFIAKQENRVVESRLFQVDLDGARRFVNISVRPIESPDAAQGCFLVVFEEVKPETLSEEVVRLVLPANTDKAMDNVVHRLEEDLEHTKRRLRLTIEQNETTVEELKASNEELQVINEELRSATEELETSKEELQSVNEELITVNHELKEKIDEVSRANADLHNLMSSSDIGTIFLNRLLQIKRYTPPVRKFFNIIPSDVGRPIEHVTHRLEYENLFSDVQEVMQSLRTIEREVRSEDDRWYIARFVPYRTADDRIDGVLLTFMDFTDRRMAQAALRESEERYRTLFDSVPVAVYTCDAEGRIQEFNRRAVELWGREPLRNNPSEKFCGSFRIFYTDGRPMPHEECPMARALRGETLKMSELEIIVEDSEGSRKNVVVSPRTLKNENGEITGAINCLYDITERNQAEEALRFQSQLLNTVEQSVIATDMEGVVTYWNRFAEKLYGWTAEEATGRNIMELTTPEMMADQAAEIMSRLRRGKSWSGEFNVKRRDGTMFPAQVFDSPIQDSKGNLIGIVGLSADITERRQGDAALRASEERFRLLIESAKDYAIFTLTSENIIDFWSTGAERMFGYTEEEALGQSGAIIFTPEDRQRNAPEWELETARTEGRAADERWHIRKDGSRLYCSGVMVSLKDDGAEGFAKIARDLTERRQMEEALKEADRRKDEFLATLAHELRNPLAPIRSGLEIIRRATSDKQARMEALGIIERQTNQVVHLVDDLLSISRITQGKITLKKARIELRAAVEMALETSGELIETADHQITITLPDVPIYLDADMVRLTQIVLNLLNNSVKYTPPGGKIWLSGEKDEKEAIIRLRDTGIGIPTEMLSRIFDMFSQIKNTADQARGGLGIGLSVVKKLVEMHDGSVEAFSEGEGKGSEFVVRLPLAAEQSKEAANDEQVSETEITQLPGLKTAESGASGKSKNRRILVVDDNADAAQMLEVLLSMEGHEVRTAFDAESGIEIAKGFEPDVCLLDIGLPEMDGYEAACALREIFPTALLISISGWGQEEDRRRSRQAGFNYHLVKPVEIEDINKLLGDSGF